MHRRDFLSAAASLVAATELAAFTPAQLPSRTRWRVIGSEAYDAIAFLGPLSGGDLYRDFYASEADEFAPRLPASIRNDIPRLAQEAEASSFGLLWPVLANILSGAGITTLESVISALANPEGRVRLAHRQNANGDDADFRWLVQRSDRLVRVFIALLDGDFASFRREKLGPSFNARIDQVARSLGRYDVVGWQEKLTGRQFDPVITVVLLAFSKPHGARMQGQTFLQAADYDTATTVRIASHEMLHPPVPMEGGAARAALEILAKDQLVLRIVRDHDPKWGYTTLEGLFNEDLAQAIDQLISEELGVSRPPAERWRKSDDGIHVLAGGLYGLLKEDCWQEVGGDLEKWLAQAAASGRLAPDILHRSAARILGRPSSKLWPLPH